MIVEAAVGAAGSFVGGHVIRKLGSPAFRESDFYAKYVGLFSLFFGSAAALLFSAGDIGSYMLENPFATNEQFIIEKLPDNMKTLMYAATGAALTAWFEYWLALKEQQRK